VGDAIGSRHSHTLRSLIQSTFGFRLCAWISIWVFVACVTPSVLPLPLAPTAASTLVHSICSQIARVYDCGDVCSGRVPDDYTELCTALPQFMGKATAQRPLLVFIDSLVCACVGVHSCCCECVGSRVRLRVDVCSSHYDFLSLVYCV
jgi:hypothetical protein